MANANADEAYSPGVVDQREALTLPTLTILGVAIHCVDFAATLDQIGAWVDAARHEENLPGSFRASWKVVACHQICTVNPEYLVLAQRDGDFAAMLARADLRVPDGVGVLLAARLHRVRLRERVTGSDGIFRICERAAGGGWRVYFLGAGPGVAAQTAAMMQQRYPSLHVAGAYTGSPDDADWPEIARRLHAAQPDILFVAYGHPRQDLWIDRHRHELPVRVAMGVGGAFDFAAGVAVRAPQWVQRLGMEWLHRLLRQPWRWRRMLALPAFVLLVIGERLRQRL
jgi:N-acetylglucosaminyldiphosphoundecaprenol N-acetyl-beta-D-mannosaminyltransferase